LDSVSEVSVSRSASVRAAGAVVAAVAVAVAVAVVVVASSLTMADAVPYTANPARVALAAARASRRLGPRSPCLAVFAVRRRPMSGEVLLCERHASTCLSPGVATDAEKVAVGSGPGGELIQC
jgi:hypothetical protein